MNRPQRPRAVWLLLVLSAAPCARAAAGASATDAIGFNTHVPSADILDALQDLGPGWIRIDLNWFMVQPSKAKAPDWGVYDQVVNQALARGLEVFVTVAYGPSWATEPDTDGLLHNNTPNPGQFQAFVEQAASHFQGRVRHWGLWNEPNLDAFFEGSEQQWIERIVIEGIKGVRAGCPACRVIGPELASIGDSYDRWLDDCLARLKKEGLQFDAVSWHIYGGFVETEPWWFCWDGDLFVHDLDQQRSCFGVPVGKPPLRSILLKHGVGHLPVWITETGKTADLGNKSEEQRQATYYRRVIEEQLQRPWWTHTFFYEIVDDPASASKWGIAARTAGSSPSYPLSYTFKAAWGLLSKVLSSQPALGGQGAACDDGLDNDGDQLIDYPQDPGCAAAGDTAETPAIVPLADAAVDHPAADASTSGGVSADLADDPGRPSDDGPPDAGVDPPAFTDIGEAVLRSDGGGSSGPQSAGSGSAGCGVGAVPRPCSTSWLWLGALALALGRRGHGLTR